jgi:hypothetical protein
VKCSDWVCCEKAVPVTIIPQMTVMSNVFFIGVLGFSVVRLLFPFHAVSGCPHRLLRPCACAQALLPERPGECHALFSEHSNVEVGR